MIKPKYEKTDLLWLGMPLAVFGAYLIDNNALMLIISLWGLFSTMFVLGLRKAELDEGT